MTRRSRRVAVTLAIALPVAGLSGTAAAAPRDDLRAAKAATAQFHDVEHALAAGYVRGSDCTEIPGIGAMGFHYINPALVADPALDPTRPEVLLYAPKANGELRLVGVEYLKVDADQNLATDDDRPSLFGRPFDGPMPGHVPGMPVHYELHVWLWQANPNGLFASWNPRVTCTPPARPGHDDGSGDHGHQQGHAD